MSWVQQYLNAGLSPIPLTKGEKAPPIHPGYQKISPVQQWQGIKQEVNIGLLCGNGFAVADGDEPRTVTNLRNYFIGLGLYEQLPEVVTTNEEHRHMYLRVEGVPDGVNSRNWSTEIGKGELRLSNAYVVAPGSTVNGIPYRFVKGSPETYRSVPVVQWKDLVWLLPPSQPAVKLTGVPVRLIHRYRLPEKAVELFMLLRSAKKGEQVAGYPSRSEAEAAIVAMMILAGSTFMEILQEFDKYQPGHYIEKGRHGQQYLETTYQNVLANITSTPERQLLANAYEFASALPWPGRSGGNDRAVMLAILAIAWQFGSYTVHASLRDIGEHASINSTETLSTATTRLHDNGHIIKRISRDIRKGNIYDLNGFINMMQYSNISLKPSKNCDLCSTNAEETWNIAEIWSPKNLGKIAPMYNALDHISWKNNSELGKALGKDARTIRNWGMRLAEHGLAISEAGENKRWKLGPRSLEEVAGELGTEEQAIGRQEGHERERDRQWRHLQETWKSPPRKETE